VNSKITCVIADRFSTCRHVSGLRVHRCAPHREGARTQFPPALLASLESLPSLVEGVAEGPGRHVTFGLGHLDRLTELVVEPRADHADMDAGLRAIEETLGSTFRVCGEPAAE